MRICFQTRLALLLPDATSTTYNEKNSPSKDLKKLHRKHQLKISTKYHSRTWRSQKCHTQTIKLNKTLVTTRSTLLINQNSKLVQQLEPTPLKKHNIGLSKLYQTAAPVTLHSSSPRASSRLPTPCFHHLKRAATTSPEENSFHNHYRLKRKKKQQIASASPPLQAIFLDMKLKIVREKLRVITHDNKGYDCGARITSDGFRIPKHGRRSKLEDRRSLSTGLQPSVRAFLHIHA